MFINKFFIKKSKSARIGLKADRYNTGSITKVDEKETVHSFIKNEINAKLHILC